MVAQTKLGKKQNSFGTNLKRIAILKFGRDLVARIDSKLDRLPMTNRFRFENSPRVAVFPENWTTLQF